MPHPPWGCQISQGPAAVCSAFSKPAREALGQLSAGRSCQVPCGFPQSSSPIAWNRWAPSHCLFTHERHRRKSLSCTALLSNQYSQIRLDLAPQEESSKSLFCFYSQSNPCKVSGYHLSNFLMWPGVSNTDVFPQTRVSRCPFCQDTHGLASPSHPLPSCNPSYSQSCKLWI